MKNVIGISHYSIGLPSAAASIFTIITLASTILFPKLSYGNECNGVSLDVQFRDCFCIEYRANHNGHCYCTVYWDFGDGNTLVNTGCDITQIHCYANPGTYTTTVYVDCPGGDCGTGVTVFIPPPNLNSAFTSDTVCEGFCTQFTDQSTGDFSDWTWDFGDGNASTQQNPCHLYANPGTYVAVLTVTDTNLCDDYDTSMVVHVWANPVADAGTYAKVCAGSSTIIGGSPSVTGGIPPWTYDWTPTTNLNCSNCANPTATPTVTSSYSLLVTDSAGCIGTDNMVLVVNPAPSAIFSVDTPCFGVANNFTDQSVGANGTWFWTFGDGDTSTVQNPSHLYAADGSYYAFLLVSSDSGCTDTIGQDVIVHPLPQVNWVSPNVCKYDSAVFTNTSTINTGSIFFWSWNFDDGNSSPLSGPSHLYSLPGTYNVTLVATSDQNCVDSLTMPIDIHPVPIANFTTANECQYDTAYFMDASTLVTGNVVSWNWDLQDGATSTLQNPSHLYSAPSNNYTISLQVTSDSGCVHDTTHNLVIHPVPVANFSTNDVCVYETAMFLDSSTVSGGNIVDWGWDFGDGTVIGPDNGPITGWPWTSGTFTDPDHKYNSYDTLVVQLTVITDSGCVDSVYGGIMIHPQPETFFVVDTPKGCELHCVNFSDLTTIPGNYTITDWNWDLDNTTSTLMNPSNICYSAFGLYQPGIYDITLITTSSAGCLDTLNQANMVTAWPVPIASFTADPNPATILYPYITFENTSQGGFEYLWDMDDGFTYETFFDSLYTHIYSNVDTIDYLVQLITISNQGCRDTAYQEIVMLGDYTLHIPNAFSPNGDGYNDFFYPQGIGFRDLKEFEFYIYDRWGDMIFHTDDVNSGWDGKANNGRKMAQQDVFVWLIITT
ncbi:MAG TPA: PKD domain-containing protein, partial [Flavobacteriales bacterium]|nr:PKD domain-containing protein [Flavobacteriales bacterium]